MADISKLEQQADLLMQNVSGWETSTLERIGKRIKKYGKLSLSDVKSINNIATVKQDMDAITKELAKVTGYNISQIEQMYGELLEEQHLTNQPLYDYRGKKFVPFAENRELQAIARAYAKTTGKTMINLAKTKALCIMDANGKQIGLQKYYTDVLDKAVMQVTTGATDFHTAMRDSIIELGGSGVRVDYGGGVTRRLDTVVRQNLLWGAKQASVEYNEMIYDELGCSGYEVDWHSNPRPSHEFMQGKQFVVGKARTINGVHFDSFDEANERLQDYGCLHYKTPIICGISEPRYSPEELKRLNDQNARRYTIDGKEYSGYEVTQMQRRLESSVRNEKTTRDLAKASGDNVLVKRCNERIKAYQGKYNEISEITGIQGDKKRMSVPKSKNVLPNNTNSGKIIKKNTNSNSSAPKVTDFVEQAIGVKKDVPIEIEDAVKGANPKFQRGTPYSVNCQRCVQAYEFRRRGYDVVAKPKPTTNNIISWGSECFIQPNAYQYSYQAYSLGNSEATIKKVLSQAPDGSRFSIYIKWQRRYGGSAHVFIAEKTNGVIRYLDPQTGDLDVSRYFSMGSKGHFGYFRMDDKSITNDTKIIFETAEVKK
jgi:hypothetical protein